jgi:WXG100 family type VII secretion target
LRQAVDSVEPEWHGVAKERFVQEFRQWEITMRQFGQLLETVGSRLEGFSNNITEMDQKGARRIRRMSSDL